MDNIQVMIAEEMFNQFGFIGACFDGAMPVIDPDQIIYPMREECIETGLSEAA